MYIYIYHDMYVIPWNCELFVIDYFTNVTQKY